MFQRSQTHLFFCQALQQFLSANPGPATSSGLLEAKKRWDLIESCWGYLKNDLLVEGKNDGNMLHLFHFDFWRILDY